MSLEESCLKVVGILTQYDLVTEKLSEEEIAQCINELKEIGYGGAFPLQGGNRRFVQRSAACC